MRTSSAHVRDRSFNCVLISWTAACCPLSLDFFADAAWCHMAAFLQKIGGEGWGEGAVLARCRPGKPINRPIGPLIHPSGRRDFVHVANIDQKATSVNPTLQTWRCPVRFLRTSLTISFDKMQRSSTVRSRSQESLTAAKSATIPMTKVLPHQRLFESTEWP